MGLFGGKSCPLRKTYAKIYGIQPPRNWDDEMTCDVCEFYEDSKCEYKKIVAQREAMIKRGEPVLAKRSRMGQPADKRNKSEAEALKRSGLSAAEQEEYRAISKEYDRLWEEASEEQRKEILDSLDQWKVNLEKGESPAQAQESVKAWLSRRAEFKAQ
jgi:hypothetical protein